jgi:hypothetical protein
MMSVGTDVEGTSELDTRGMTCLTEEIRLTPEQDRFAREHRATATTHSAHDRSVCLYAHEAHRTVRWIVDEGGQLLELTAFRRG